MENELIERVSRAVFPNEWLAIDRELIPRGVAQAARAGLLARARDGIEAMREPTEAMLRASPVVGTGPDENGNWAVNTKPAQVMWPAMIDAALTPA